MMMTVELELMMSISLLLSIGEGLRLAQRPLSQV